MGFTLPCADHEKMVWRFVSVTISSAVIGAMVSVVGMPYFYAIDALRSSPHRAYNVGYDRDRYGAPYDRHVPSGPGVPETHAAADRTARGAWTAARDPAGRHPLRSR